MPLTEQLQFLWTELWALPPSTPLSVWQTEVAAWKRNACPTASQRRSYYQNNLPKAALMSTLQSIQGNFNCPPNNPRQSSNHSSAPQSKASVTFLEALPQQLVGHKIGAEGRDVSCKSEKWSPEKRVRRIIVFIQKLADEDTWKFLWHLLPLQCVSGN